MSPWDVCGWLIAAILALHVFGVIMRITGAALTEYADWKKSRKK